MKDAVPGDVEWSWEGVKAWGYQVMLFQLTFIKGMGLGQ